MIGKGYRPRHQSIKQYYRSRGNSFSEPDAFYKIIILKGTVSRDFPPLFFRFCRFPNKIFRRIRSHMRNGFRPWIRALWDWGNTHKPPSNISFFRYKNYGVDLFCDEPGKHKNSFLKVLCQESMRWDSFVQSWLGYFWLNRGRNFVFIEFSLVGYQKIRLFA
jgi:hypothetical protein